MEDIIDIIVTETTNTIEITAQPNDEIIDVNIIDNREDITLNVTPTVVEININQLTGNFGILWGEIEGTLSNQTDLNNALALKANLVGGKVPASELPSYVDDVVEVANFASLPVTGETGKIYITLDTNFIYRWTGSTYVEIKDSSAVWGAITGTLSNQTDLQNALNAKQNQLNGTGFVKASGTTISYDNSTYLTTSSAASTYLPLSGGIISGTLTVNTLSGLVFADVDGQLGTTSGTTDTLAYWSSSRTVASLPLSTYPSLTELSYVKGVTSAIQTQLNAKQAALSGTGFVKISGTTISYDNSTYLTTSAAASTYLALTGGTLTGALIGTRAEFTTSTLVDGVLVNNGSGRGIRIVNAGAGFGLIINNETASSAIPFLIQKSGVDRIFFTDAGLGSFASSLTASSFIRSGGTSSQFLKADGSVDSTSYQPTLTNPVTGTGTSNRIAKFNGTSTITDSIIYDNGSRVSIGANVTTSDTLTSVSSTTSAYAVVAQASGAANGFWSTILGTGEIFRGQTSGGSYFIINNGGNAFLNGNLNVGDFASTSFRLNVVGTGNFTGALSGTSASFSGDVTLGASATPFIGNNIYLRGRNVANSAYKAMIGIGGSGSIAPDKVLIDPDNNGSHFGGAATFSGSINAGGTIRTDVGSLSVGAGSGSYFTRLITEYNFPYVNSYLDSMAGASYDGRLTFRIQRNGGTVSPVMSIIENGSVGIGTTAPESLLHLSQASVGGEGAFIFIDNPASSTLGNKAGIRFATNSGATFSGYGSFIEAINTNAGNGAEDLTFGTWNGSSRGERMRITSGGFVLIGSTAADPVSSNVAGISFEGALGSGKFSRINNACLDVNRVGGTDGEVMRMYKTGSQVGNISVTSSSTSYNTSSDYRLKQDLKPINGLQLVNKINVYNYEWKSDKTRMDGVIAHELQEILPYAVTGVKDGEQMQSVDYSKIVPVMVQAIKDLKAELDTLKNK